MKPRRVVITIETDTDRPLRVLRAWKGHWIGGFYYPDSAVVVNQIQVNVITPKKKETPR